MSLETIILDVYFNYYSEDWDEDTPEHLYHVTSLGECGDSFTTKDDKGKKMEGRICSHSGSVVTDFIFDEQLEKYQYYG